MGDPKAVAAQIRMKLPSQTPLEGTVAADIPARKDIGETMALREVAERSGVSDAMVVKVAKKPGFAGFREFRQALVDYNRSDTAALHSEISDADTTGEIVQKVFRTALQAIEETFAILDLDAYERAVDDLHRARQRDFYGLGGSAQIAPLNLPVALFVATAQRDRPARPQVGGRQPEPHHAGGAIETQIVR